MERVDVYRTKEASPPEKDEAAHPGHSSVESQRRGEEAPELLAEASPELTDSSSATESFAPGAAAARNAARFGLTTREHEILILLVQSHPMKTDQELATDLCIAIKTVNAHVGHILGKLGLKSRRELPAFAAKHGLLPPSTPNLLPE